MRSTSVVPWWQIIDAPRSLAARLLSLRTLPVLASKLFRFSPRHCASVGFRSWTILCPWHRSYSACASFSLSTFHCSVSSLKAKGDGPAGARIHSRRRSAAAAGVTEISSLLSSTEYVLVIGSAPWKYVPRPSLAKTTKSKLLFPQHENYILTSIRNYFNMQ